MQKKLVSLSDGLLSELSIELLEPKVEKSYVSVIDLMVERVDIFRPNDAIPNGKDECGCDNLCICDDLCITDWCICEAHCGSSDDASQFNVCTVENPGRPDMDLNYAKDAVGKQIDLELRDWVPVMKTMGHEYEEWKPDAALDSDGLLFLPKEKYGI